MTTASSHDIQVDQWSSPLSSGERHHLVEYTHIVSYSFIAIACIISEPAPCVSCSLHTHCTLPQNMSAWYPLWLDPWPFSLKYSNSAAEGCVAPVEVQPNRNSVSQGQQVSLRVEERHFRLKKNLWSNLQVETINTGTGTREPGTQEPNVLRAVLYLLILSAKNSNFSEENGRHFPRNP